MTQPYIPLLDAQTAIGYLIAAGGNAKLAALSATRNAQKTDPTISINEAQLLASITQDPSSIAPLTQQLNLLLILNTVESLRLAHHAFVQALPQLSPQQASSTYIKLLQVLTAIARPDPGAPISSPEAQLTTDKILEALPTEVSDAIKQLMSPANPDQTGSAP